MNEYIYYNEPLANHTTFRIGGPAEFLVIPPNKESLIEVVEICRKSKTPFFILGRGSNVLICDEGLKGVVIKNTHACTQLQVDQNYVKAGSSVSLQRLVKFCLENNLYGMEYLYSIPGNIGGAVHMNAGRGKRFAQSISNNVTAVEIFDGKKPKVISNKKCNFGYRSSTFQKKKDWVILSVILNLPKQDRETGEQKIKERIKFVRKEQDLKYPNAGTVFKSGFQPLPEIVGYHIGNAMFSTKTHGWIINLGGATFKDSYELIRYAIACHKKRGLAAPKLEIDIIQQSWWKRTRQNFMLNDFIKDRIIKALQIK